MWASETLQLSNKGLRQQQLVANKKRKSARKRQSNDAKKSSAKLKTMIFFHTLNKYKGIKALSKFRSGFLYWIIKVSLINNFRQWPDLAMMTELLKQTEWLGLLVKYRVTSISHGVLEVRLLLLMRVIRFGDVWPMQELPQLSYNLFCTRRHNDREFAVALYV